MSNVFYYLVYVVKVKETMDVPYAVSVAYARMRVPFRAVLLRYGPGRNALSRDFSGKYPGLSCRGGGSDFLT